MARMQSPPQELEFHHGTVYARTTIHKGTKYGPYAVKWTSEPIDKQLAWEVSENHHYFLIQSEKSQVKKKSVLVSYKNENKNINFKSQITKFSSNIFSSLPSQLRISSKIMGRCK